MYRCGGYYIYHCGVYYVFRCDVEVKGQVQFQHNACGICKVALCHVLSEIFFFSHLLITHPPLKVGTLGRFEGRV